MKKSYIYFIYFLICSAGYSLLGEEQSNTSNIQFETFLKTTGKRYSLFFTVEGAYEKQNSQFPFGEKVLMTDMPTNISSAIFALTNSIANLAVIADIADKRIYHIVDVRLLEKNGCHMNEVMDSAKFQGKANKFVNFINGRVPGLSNESIYANSDFVAANWLAVISIDATNISVRDALSDGINLQGYNRIIWKSFTSLETLKTTVQYLGPRSPLDP